jgi:hypothetical protein
MPNNSAQFWLDYFTHMAQMRVRPSKPMSALGALVGLIFVVVGIFFSIRVFSLGAPLAAKAFSIGWTLVGTGHCVYHLANLFSRRGAAHNIVDTDK